MKVNRVEQHQINKNHQLFQLLDEYSFKSKNLYNYANYLVRQTFIITSNLKDNKELTQEQQSFLNWINLKVDEFNVKKQEVLKKKQFKGKNLDKQLKALDYFHGEHKYLGYDFLEFLCSNSEDYRVLMSQVAQQTLRVLDKNWQSFFQSMNKWRKCKDGFTGRPKLPKYKHKTKGRFNVYFTNQNCKFVGDSIKFPKCLNQYLLKTKINGKLQQVRIKPLGSKYLIEIVYQKEIGNLEFESKNICSIDLGLDNLPTLTNNAGIIPVIINGKPLKSINQYFNKQKSKIVSILKTNNNKDWCRSLDILTTKRNNKVKNYLHKASKIIIDYCIKNNFDTIVIGNNKGWKQEVNLGSRNNQNFVGIPYHIFIQMIAYKAENVGIKVIITEESYTSGTSFLDGNCL
ncbi:RNA-guided endonuclease InsQ/TnpB family protein [Clostridium kluyveri]|uniref:RNA-guided endonuclease InsQ/TnpB family protein n=1 Tax=Clostridium kluyveri TaxID=1534 RepID=UPI000B06C61A|nr:transposase [Clostridium kluyveri]UZQ50439.1 transposase [Clostridium kluyveri]